MGNFDGIWYQKKCREWFDKLASLLSDKYEVVQSCNKDFSAYLVPKGTSDQITYHSKPAFSFRISDHWNWYANTKKCKNPHYVQCLNVDLPRARRRNKEAFNMATKPRKACCVAYCAKNGVYMTVYGSRFSRTTQDWDFLESDPQEIIDLLGLQCIFEEDRK